MLQNRLGWLIVGRKFMVTALFLRCYMLYLRTIPKYNLPGACSGSGNLMEGFFCTRLGLIHGGVYFRELYKLFLWKP